MDKNLRTALDRLSSAMEVLQTAAPSYEDVAAAKMDLECACAALDAWLEDRVMDEPAIYHRDCPTCQRGLAHTQQQHDDEIERVLAASRS